MRRGIQLYTVQLYAVQLSTVQLSTVQLYTVQLYAVQLYTVQLYTVQRLFGMRESIFSVLCRTNVKQCVFGKWKLLHVNGTVFVSLYNGITQHCAWEMKTVPSRD